jgi:hypothetical protein
LLDNPNQLVFTNNQTNTDILSDGFGQGTISVKSGTADVSAVDRITSKHIEYGSAYHDLTQTSFTQTSTNYIAYLQSGYGKFTIPTKPVSTIGMTLAPLQNTISPNISVGVDSGGRSGLINFDGSIDINVGANTVDKQSLMLDTQGSVIANLGKDKRGISVDFCLDGAVIGQIGSFGVNGDSRFPTETMVGGVLDVRILSSTGQASIIRFDDSGYTIISQARSRFHSAGDMTFTSDSKIQFDAPQVVIQNRLVNRNVLGSI